MLLNDLFHCGAFPTTSLHAYQVLLTLADKAAVLSQPERSAGIETTVVLSPHDGLVNIQRLRGWLERNQLGAWRLAEIEPQPEIEGTRHHLIIDQHGLGRLPWQRLVELLERAL
jgi:hypothetical protein